MFQTYSRPSSGGSRVSQRGRQPIITARKRSLGQGDMFTGVYLSTGEGGAVVPGHGGLPGPEGGA